MARARSLFRVVFALTFATAAAAAPVAPGFHVEPVTEGGALSFVTGLAFDADGTLFVSEGNLFTGTGRVLRITDEDGDSVRETVTVHADGFGIVTGIAFKRHAAPQPHGRVRRPGDAGPRTELERIRRGELSGQRLDLVVSHFAPGMPGGGAITIVRDRNGDCVAEDRADIVTGLPSDGLNGNQQPAIGPDGRIYFGQGARTNAGVPSGGGLPDTPQNAAILSVQPDGSGLEVHASGLRNAYDLAFTPDGELFATENGPDPSGPGPVPAAPDELNAIIPGGDYGWPAWFGFPPENTGTIGPIATFSPSTSTDGLALSTSPSFCGFEGDFFAAQFGSFTDPSIGRKVVRIDRRGARAIVVEDLATGFGRPLDVAVGPDGSLYVAEFSNVAFSPNTARIWRITPEDADGDSVAEICE